MNGLSESSRARQRRRREQSNSVGMGVAVSAAMGDVPPQNASVVRRQLPVNVGQYVNGGVIGRSHSNGEVRKGSDSADENMKPGRRKSAADVTSQSSGDAKATRSVSSEPADNVVSSVIQVSHLLTTCTFCLIT